MLLRFAAPIAALFLAWPAWAAPSDDLFDALGVAEMVEIMRVEGETYGEDLATDMLPGGSDPGWMALVAEIYDTDLMLDSVRRGFNTALDDTDIGGLLTFFESDIGTRIVELEISAREAMVDQGIEDAAREAYRLAAADEDPRLDLIDRFVSANDLIEANVVGALNASFMFYKGLADGGALEMGESEMLADVWQQEEETRADTREWLYAYMMLAYGPLEDTAVERYADLSATPEGKAMNRALFAGFNAMYDDLSYALGLAIARQMQGQDL